MKKLTSAILFIGLSSATSQLLAMQCPNGFSPAIVDVNATISTSIGCPILEDRKLYRLVNKHAVGAAFAGPGFCATGEGLTGTVSIAGVPIAVEGSSESGQIFSATAAAFGNPLLLDNSTAVPPNISGAAISIVSLQGVETDLELTVVMSDNFTINLSDFVTGTGPAINIEDHTIIHSSGDFRTRGHLTSTAVLFSLPPVIEDAPFNISGEVCVKPR